MGYKPLFIDRVAMKSKSNMVEYAPLSHRFQGFFHHPQGVFFTGSVIPPQQEKTVVGRRELRGLGESSPFSIEAPLQVLVTGIKDPGIQVHARSSQVGMLYGRGDFLAGIKQLGAVILP